MKHTPESRFKTAKNLKLLTLIAASLILFASIVLLASKPVFGQAGMTITSGMGGGASSVARVQAQAMQLQARLSAVETCLRKGMVYAPSAADADADECIFADNPELGDIQVGRLCRSDGSQILCDSEAPSWNSNNTLNIQDSPDLGHLRARRITLNTGVPLAQDTLAVGPGGGGGNIRVWGPGWFEGEVTVESNVTAAEPTNSNHLTTKNYVDSAISGAVATGGDNLGNHTATQNLSMGGNAITGLADPTGSLQATNKQYVDNAISTAVAPFVVGGDDLGNHLALQALRMGGHRVTEVGTPSANTDAATKGYVDSAISGVSGGGGGGDNLGDHNATTNLNMNGKLIFNLAAPTGNSNAATKGYVDSAISGVSGGGGGDNLGNHSATQDLNMGGNSITGLANPTGPLQATHKQYVDTAVAGAGGDNLGSHNATTRLNMNGNPIVNLPNPTGPAQATNKQYVDAAVSGAGGDNLGSHNATTRLNMNGNSIVSLADPAGTMQATNKRYVDGQIADLQAQINSLDAALVGAGLCFGTCK